MHSSFQAGEFMNKMITIFIFTALFLLQASCLQVSTEKTENVASPTPSKLSKTEKPETTTETKTTKQEELNSFSIELNKYRNESNKEYLKNLEAFSLEIKKNPTSKSFFKRGVFYYNQKEYKKAIDDFDSCIKYDPKNADAYIYRGRINLITRKNESAPEDFDNALAINPDYPLAKLGKAEYYISMGKFEQAQSEIEMIKNHIVTDHDKYLFYLGKAKISMSSGKMEDTLNYLDAAKKYNPNDTKIHYLLFSIYLMSNRKTEAGREIDAILKQRPYDSQSYIGQAWFHQSLFQYKNADLCFDKAIMISPDDHLMYMYKAMFYMDLKDYNQAITWLTKTIEKNKNFYDAYYYRGLTYYKLGKKEMALSDLKKARELDPESSLGKMAEKQIERISDGEDPLPTEMLGDKRRFP